MTKTQTPPRTAPANPADFLAIASNLALSAAEVRDAGAGDATTVARVADLAASTADALVAITNMLMHQQSVIALLVRAVNSDDDRAHIGSARDLVESIQRED